MFIFLSRICLLTISIIIQLNDGVINLSLRHAGSILLPALLQLKGFCLVGQCRKIDISVLDVAYIIQLGLSFMVTKVSVTY